MPLCGECGEQSPSRGWPRVPLAPLAELVAHEQQLLARMRGHERVQRAQCRGLLPGVARHLVEHRPLAVDDLVVRVRQDEVLGERVEHREGDLVLRPAPMHRIARRELQRVVHPPHVPLVSEAEAAQVHGTAHAWPRRRFLGHRDRARHFDVREGVELLQELTASRFSRPPNRRWATARRCIHWQQALR